MDHGAAPTRSEVPALDHGAGPMALRRLLLDRQRPRRNPEAPVKVRHRPREVHPSVRVNLETREMDLATEEMDLHGREMDHEHPIMDHEHPLMNLHVPGRTTSTHSWTTSAHS